MIRRFARKPVGVAAAAWLLLVLVCAVFAPLIAPYDPQAQDLPAALSGPSGSHLLGADQLGRDVLSQLIYGARPALIGVVCAVATWLVLGVSLGITGRPAALSTTLRRAARSWWRSRSHCDDFRCRMAAVAAAQIAGGSAVVKMKPGA